MKKINIPRVGVVLTLMLFLTGCLTFGQKQKTTAACGDAYAKIKTDNYALSSKAKKKLRKMNKSIAEDDDLEVQLASCNSAVTLIIGREIGRNVSKLCKQEGLTEKEREDCKETGCRSRMKKEWCGGYSGQIKGALDACSPFEFDMQKCVYK